MGKELGFLPGSLEEKLAPWMQPIHDALEMLGDLNMGHEHRRSGDLMRSGSIVVEALSYIRGRSIANQFMIIDEAQNLTPAGSQDDHHPRRPRHQDRLHRRPLPDRQSVRGLFVERVQLRRQPFPRRADRRAHRIAERRTIGIGGAGGEYPVRITGDRRTAAATSAEDVAGSIGHEDQRCHRSAAFRLQKRTNT